MLFYGKIKLSEVIMIDFEDIISALKGEYDSGMTYEQIARKHGVSYTYIHNLFSGKRAVEGLTLKKINKLFPKAVLHLSGDNVSVHADHNSGNVVGVNNGTIDAGCMAAVLEKILESDELSDTEKIKVMKVLKK